MSTCKHEFTYRCKRRTYNSATGEIENLGEMECCRSCGKILAYITIDDLLNDFDVGISTTRNRDPFEGAPELCQHKWVTLFSSITCEYCGKDQREVKKDE